MLHVVDHACTDSPDSKVFEYVAAPKLQRATDKLAV
jgi:hypothetical protein